MHFICVWLRTCSTISSQLDCEHIRNLLICCRIQQKIQETHKICILVNKATHLFSSIRGNSRGCAKVLEISRGDGGTFWGLILENPEGREGHTANPFRGCGADIFWNHSFYQTTKGNSTSDNPIMT